MNAIEEKIWEYIDGSCPADDYEAMSLLIEQDELYRAKYAELLKLNMEFTALALEAPPMGLTYKVMETIRAENARKPLQTSINHSIIKVIAGFYLFIILALIIFLLANIRWSAGVGNFQFPGLKLPEISNYLLKGTALQAFLFFDFIVGLLFLDTILRAKSEPKLF